MFRSALLVQFFAYLLLFIIVGTYAAAYWVFPHPIVENDEFGTFGDFVGGMLNPLLSFLSFTAVLYSLWVQRHEAKAAEADRRAEQEIAKEQLRLMEEEARQNVTTLQFQQIVAQFQLKHMTEEADRNAKARRVEQEIAQGQLRQMRREAELNEITRLLSLVDSRFGRLLNEPVDIPEFAWGTKYQGGLFGYLDEISRYDRYSATRIGWEIRRNSLLSIEFIRAGEILSVVNDHLIAYTAEKPDERFLKHYREKYLSVARAILFLGFLDREDVSLLLSDDDLGDGPLFPID